MLYVIYSLSEAAMYSEGMGMGRGGLLPGLLKMSV